MRMASPRSQTPPSAVLASCQCGRCGEILSACRLEPAPVSRDPTFHTGLGQYRMDRVHILLLRVPDEEGNGSRRRSGKSLYEYWRKLDLLESDFGPFRILPEWAQKDEVLRQIEGLPPANETHSQWLARVQKELKDDPFCCDGPVPGVSPLSISTFTSYGSRTPDARLFDPLPMDPLEQEAGASRTGHRTVKVSSSASMATMDEGIPGEASCIQTEEHMHNSGSIPENHHGRSPLTIGDLLLLETNHDSSNAESRTSGPSSKSCSDSSSPQTPLSSWQTADAAEIAKISPACTRTETGPPDLHQNIPLMNSKYPLPELDYSNNQGGFGHTSITEDAHRPVENDELVGKDNRTQASTARVSNMLSERVDSRTQVSLKRKRRTELALLSNPGSTSIDPSQGRVLRPQKRVKYKT